jgi:hypothetical protein
MPKTPPSWQHLDPSSLVVQNVKINLAYGGHADGKVLQAASQSIIVPG